MPEAADNPEFGIRITVDGATGASGNNRFDNITLDGAPTGTAPATVSFTDDSATVTEGESVTLTVQLSDPAGEPVSVDVVLTAGDADEFEPPYTTQTVTFPADAEDGATQSITLATGDDDEFTGSRQVTFQLQNASGAAIAAPSTFTLTILDNDDPPAPDSPLVINEYHPVVDTPTDDANNDGASDACHDEFVELVNVTEAPLDISGWYLRDRFDTRDFHVFSAGTVVPAGQAVVVFGGGDPQGRFGGALVQVRTGTCTSALANAGDRIRLFDADDTLLEDHGYGGQAQPGEPAAPPRGISLVRSPELTGPFVAHTATASGLNYSPGYQSDGTTTFGGANDAVATVIKGQRGWRMLASSTGNTTVADLAAQNLVQGIPGEYPEAVANLYTAFGPIAVNGETTVGWSTPVSTADVLEPGRGFIWFFFNRALNPDDETGTSQSFPLSRSVSFYGDAPATDVAVPLHVQADGEGAVWNLLGNPHDEAVNLDDLQTTGGDLASVVGQVWDPNAGENGSYTLTTAESNLGEGANTLAIAQSAFFESDSDDPATEVVFPLAAKLGSGDVFYGRPGGESPVRLVGFRLAGTDDAGQAVEDRAAVLYLRDGALDGWDRWDARKLTPLAGTYATIAFVGERAGSEILKAQESRPVDPEPFTVPLAVETAGVAGTLTLTWPRVANVPETWSLTLTDLATGETVDLLSAESYAFTVEATRPGNPESPLFIPHAVPQSRSSTPRFSLAVSRGSVSADDTAAPLAFGLTAVAPNPLAARAAVSFTLPAAADVSLALYDVLGRRVATLAEGEHAAGAHRVGLDASGLSSGVYVVRLTAGEQVDARRVTVVR